MKSTHCKFTCTKLESLPGNDAKKYISVTMNTVYDEKSIDDQSFSKATPNGNMAFTLANENVIPMFQLGKKYKVIIEEIQE